MPETFTHVERERARERGRERNQQQQLLWYQTLITSNVGLFAVMSFKLRPVKVKEKRNRNAALNPSVWCALKTSRQNNLALFHE